MDRNWKEHLPENKWEFDGTCMCDGTLGMKYVYIADRDIHVKVQPNVKKVSVYGPGWGAWSKPLSALASLLCQYKL